MHDYSRIPIPQYKKILTKERWLSVEEIAAYLGINRDTVYKWIIRKNMPAHKLGRLWKFRTNEIDKWIESGGASHNSEMGRSQDE